MEENEGIIKSKNGIKDDTNEEKEDNKWKYMIDDKLKSLN